MLPNYRFRFTCLTLCILPWHGSWADYVALQGSPGIFIECVHSFVDLLALRVVVFGEVLKQVYSFLGLNFVYFDKVLFKKMENTF